MNTSTLHRPARFGAWLAIAFGLVFAFALGGCAAPVPAPPTHGVSLQRGVNAALDFLMSQTTPSWVPTFDPRTLVIQPPRDKATDQQTASTREVGRLLGVRLKDKFPAMQVLPYGGAELARARWVLDAQLISGESSKKAADPSPQTLELVLTELASGRIVARSSVLIVDDRLDNSPTAYYRSSPVLIRMSPTDTPRPPSAFASDLAAASLIERAMAAYEAGDDAAAQAFFTQAGKAPGADALSVNTGLYLVYVRTGQTAAAREAFGRMAAAGIARRSLAVKFLFEPGQVEFWADPAVSGPYGMWIDQIAQQVVKAQSCMSIVGHSSHTGAEDFNDQLSRDRAARVGDLLQKSAGDTKLRLRASGRGFRENLVGTGTDDARDALDRRVEFKFSNCAAESANVSTRAPG